VSICIYPLSNLIISQNVTNPSQNVTFYIDTKRDNRYNNDVDTERVKKGGN